MDEEVKTYSKLELAEHQLQRGLMLFLKEGDAISAITLAGASDEILGKGFTPFSQLVRYGVTAQPIINMMWLLAVDGSNQIVVRCKQGHF